MSVTTTSDEKRAAGKEKLKEAHNLLKEAQELISKLIDDYAWGANDYREEYKETLIALEGEIVSVRINVNQLIRKI